MITKSYTIEKVVPQRAIDELGHVNNIVYLEWVQEISALHWEYEVPKALRNHLFWVVLHHFITYKKPAYQDDVLRLTTWVECMEGVKSERYVEIYRKKDDALLVRAKTLWCLLEREKQRPKRISEEVKALFV